MDASVTTPTRRVERVRFELQRRPVRLVHVDRPSPGFARLVFGGPALAGFTSLSFDDHVKLIVEPEDGGERWMRDLTPRAFDAERLELTIEVALHGHGPASAWARDARVGQAAVIGGPRGSMILPPDFDWQLLVGDAAALPAIARRLEELPADAVVRARLLVDPADRRSFNRPAGLDLQWFSDTAAWLAALRAQPLPPGDGFAWCAGEARVMAELRQVLSDHHHLPREAMRVAAYWKAGASAFHEQLGA